MGRELRPTRPPSPSPSPSHEPVPPDRRAAGAGRGLRRHQPRSCRACWRRAGRRRPRRRPTSAASCPTASRPSASRCSFYLVAMIFIVFDIEIIFLYPCAIVFRRPRRLRARRRWSSSSALFFVSFVYLIANGALDWGPVAAAAPARVVDRRRSSAARAPPRTTSAGSALEGRRRPRPERRPEVGVAPERSATTGSTGSTTTSSPARSRTSSSGPGPQRRGRPPSGWPAAPSR